MKEIGHCSVALPLLPEERWLPAGSIDGLHAFPAALFRGHSYCVRKRGMRGRQSVSKFERRFFYVNGLTRYLCFDSYVPKVSAVRVADREVQNAE
jgi:hypothetical protein